MGSSCWPCGLCAGGSTGAERRTWTGTLTSAGPPPGGGAREEGTDEKRRETEMSNSKNVIYSK